MEMISVSIQPFGPVAVTVYVPGIVIEIVAVFPILVLPFDQVYELPPVPFSVIEGVLQVSICVFGDVEIDGVGMVIS
jgi:hypothetical protein